jgi:hypothetical protein
VTPTARWLPRIAIAFVLWLAVAAIGGILGNHPRPGLLALTIGVGGAVVWLLLDVSGDAETAQWPGMVEEPVRPPGEDPRLERLQRILLQHETAHEVGDALHRQLAELAEHRLVAHHGVSLVADPERAARILGPELTAVVNQRAPYPRLSTGRIDVLLKRIEEL